MDPRHPELAVARLKELIKQYDTIEERMAHATTTAQLSQAEREGGLVIQEMCLVAPRLHEALIQASRNRRHELTRGMAFDYIPEEKVGDYTKATIAIEEDNETYVATNQAETVIVEPKPCKKRSTKKKKAKDGSRDNKS